MKKTLKIFGGIFAFGLVIGVVFFLLTPKRIPLAESEKYLRGKWISQNHEYFIIFPDGKGTLEFSSLSMSGAVVQRFKEPQTISFHVGPMKKKLLTDGKVESDENGVFLVIEGEKFYKEGAVSSQLMSPEKGAKLNLETLKAINTSFKENNPSHLIEKFPDTSSLTEKVKADISSFVERGHRSNLSLDEYLENFPAASNISYQSDNLYSVSNLVYGTNGNLDLKCIYALINGEFKLTQYEFRFNK